MAKAKLYVGDASPYLYRFGKATAVAIQGLQKAIRDAETVCFRTDSPNGAVRFLANCTCREEKHGWHKEGEKCNRRAFLVGGFRCPPCKGGVKA